MIKSLAKVVEDLTKEGQALLMDAEEVSDDILQASDAGDDPTPVALWILGQYQTWFSSTRPLIQANMQERLQEYDELYGVAVGAGRKLVDERDEFNWVQYRSMCQAVKEQIGILKAVPRVLEARSLSLRGLLARDLMDSELGAAQHLLTNGYIREAGVIAGVVLERHLRSMCEKREIALGPRETLGEMNQKLRAVYPEESEFRRVQWMNEIRATCAHEKANPPDTQRVEQFLVAVRDFVLSVN